MALKVLFNPNSHTLIQNKDLWRFNHIDLLIVELSFFAFDCKRIILRIF